VGVSVQGVWVYHTCTYTFLSYISYIYIHAGVGRLGVRVHGLTLYPTQFTPEASEADTGMVKVRVRVGLRVRVTVRVRGHGLGQGQGQG